MGENTFHSWKSWKDALVLWHLLPASLPWAVEGGGRSGSGKLGWPKSIVSCSPGWGAPGTGEVSALDNRLFLTSSNLQTLWLKKGGKEKNS